MSYLFKDFLNLEDVGEYLNQYGYSYDPEIEEDYYRLKDTVLDLYNEQKLSIVFYYDDFATIRTLQTAENGLIEQIEEFEFHISGYFHAPEATSVLKEGANLRIIQSYYCYYLLHDKGELPIYDDDNKYKNIIGSKFTSIEFGDDIAPSIVEFGDIRFPKADLDKLFNEKNSELKSVKDELADVKAQNAKLVADIKESKTTGNFSMGTPTVSHGEPRTNEQLIKELADANAKIERQDQEINRLNKHLTEQAQKATEDKELPYNSQMGVARMLYGILKEHKYDITATRGKANELIENASQIHGTPITRNFIAKWIELANQAKSDSTK